MSDVECIACGSIGAILIACSKCRSISYCKVCEPELDFERVEKRLCETCFQNFSKEKETKEIIASFSSHSELFEKIKKEQSEEIRVLLERTDMSKAMGISGVICAVLGSILLLRYPNPDFPLEYCVLAFAFLFISGFFGERHDAAKRETELNLIMSEKRFPDYSEKEKDEWIYNQVVSGLTYSMRERGEDYETEDKWEYEMIKIRIKKVIESLK